MRECVSACVRVCVCACVCVCVCARARVVSVTVKHPVLRLCEVDGRSRNPLYVHVYFIFLLYNVQADGEAVSFSLLFAIILCQSNYQDSATPRVTSIRCPGGCHGYVGDLDGG